MRWQGPREKSHVGNDGESCYGTRLAAAGERAESAGIHNNQIGNEGTRGGARVAGRQAAASAHYVLSSQCCSAAQLSHREHDELCFGRRCRELLRGSATSSRSTSGVSRNTQQSKIGDEGTRGGARVTGRRAAAFAHYVNEGCWGHGQKQLVNDVGEDH